MGRNKTTVQDIADSLGYSRTTVSKVLNNSAGVSEKTRSIVLARAKSLNYKAFQEFSSPAARDASADGSVRMTGNIALFLRVVPDSFHMSSYLMMSLEQALGKIGYSMSLHLITDSNLQNLSLPASFHPLNVDAIFCLELYDKSYCEFVCTLGKPVLFSDIYSSFRQGDLAADVLVADNYTASVKLYSSIIEERHPGTIGFLGDPNHCLSFYDRYKGFLFVVENYGMAEHFMEHSVIDEDRLFLDEVWLQDRLSSIELPDLLVCANDILAMKTLTCLDKMGKKVPDDVMVCGYDGTPAISALNSSLTTIIAPSEQMGIMAAEILSHKIKNPTLPNMMITMNSKISKNVTTGTFTH